MKILKGLRHITRRRSELATLLMQHSVRSRFDESCIPSYAHRNRAAAAVAWWRLFVAADLCCSQIAARQILDFGASTGELAWVLGERTTEYRFIEEDEVLVSFLQQSMPRAIREHLDRLPSDCFDAVFCLDSLEHNVNIGLIVQQLKGSLKHSGVLVVSGPTENWVYRVGRRIAGFSGDYHVQTIYEVEDELAKHFQLIKRTVGPLLPLFAISVWMPLP